MRNFSRRGMSLVEIMIVMAVLIIVVLALYMILFRSARAYTDSSKMGTLEESGRLALDEVARELREADSTAIVMGSGGVSLQFRVPTGFTAGAGGGIPGTVTWSGNILYQLAGSPVDANGNGSSADDFKLIRVQNGVTRTVCHYVQTGGLLFTRSGNNMVMKLTLNSVDDKRNVLTRTVQSSVMLRNKP